MTLLDFFSNKHDLADIHLPTVKMWAFLETKTLIIEPLADSPVSLGLAGFTDFRDTKALFGHN